MSVTRHPPRRVIVWPAAALACGSAASADPHGMFFAVSNVVSPDNPSATIDLWTYFQPDFYAFGGAGFDVVASPDPGGFGEPVCLLNHPGNVAGTVAPDADSVLGVRSGQLHMPDAGIFADTANPILHWRIAWSTDDFTPRRVTLATFTQKYVLYLDQWGTGVNAFDETFTEAQGMINIVPAPAAGAAMIGLAWATLRRRYATR